MHFEREIHSMNENLNLDYDKIEESMNNLSAALEEYSKYENNPFGDYLDELDIMNSDFIAKLKTMVKTINDDNEKLSSNYKDIYDTVQDLYDIFDKLDKDFKKQAELNDDGE